VRSTDFTLPPGRISSGESRISSVPCRNGFRFYTHNEILTACYHTDSMFHLLTDDVKLISLRKFVTSS